MNLKISMYKLIWLHFNGQRILYKLKSTKEDHMMSRKSMYTDEFKGPSVELALNSDKPLIQTAKDLGVHIKTFYNWVKLHRESNQVMKSSPFKPSLEEENKRLRKENTRLKEQL